MLFVTKMIEINLLPEELKAKPKSQKAIVDIKTEYFLYLIPLILCILICVHIFLAGLTFTKNSQLCRLNNKWNSLEPQRKILEGFNKEYAITSEDALIIKQLIERRISWSEKLNKLSLLLPSGIWFNDISISPKDLTLSGSVVSLQKEEMNLIKKLIDNLKNDASFFKDFTNLELGSMQRKTIGGYDVLDFILVAILKSR